MSSLDNNGGSPNEQGTIYWSNTLSITGASSFGYQAGVFGANVFGDIVPSIGAAFDPFAKYLMFRAGPDGGP